MDLPRYTLKREVDEHIGALLILLQSAEAWPEPGLQA